jgi:catalase
MHSPKAAEAFVSYTEKVEGRKIRERSESFSDHFSQATLFWNSMTSWEKQHIVEAFSFELNKVDTLEVRVWVLNELLVNVHPDLAQEVGNNIGVSVNAGSSQVHDRTSPALSIQNLIGTTVKGRVVALLTAEGVSASQADSLIKELSQAEVRVELIAPVGGKIKQDNGRNLAVNKALPTTASVFYDGVIVLENASQDRTVFETGRARHFISEAYMHGKTIGAIDAGIDLLKALNLPNGREPEPGIVFAAGGANLSEFVQKYLDALKKHRYFDRDIEKVPA